TDAGDPQIDLAHLEADHLDTEVEIGQREILELLGEQPLVPLGILGEPVIGDYQGAALRFAEPIEHDRRDLGPAELDAGEEPTMSSNQVALAVDEGRDGKAEGLDRSSELFDLLSAVLPGVLG